jgi:Flp pilus assembly protein TadB
MFSKIKAKLKRRTAADSMAGAERAEETSSNIEAPPSDEPESEDLPEKLGLRAQLWEAFGLVMLLLFIYWFIKWTYLIIDMFD